MNKWINQNSIMPKPALQKFVQLMGLNEKEATELFRLAGHRRGGEDFEGVKSDLTNCPNPESDENLSSLEATQFPMTAYQHDEVKPQCYMKTTVYLDETGHLEGNAHLWTEKWFSGFTGGIFVMFRDKNNNIIWGTGTHTFGVNGRKVPPCPSDRCVFWWDESALRRDLSEVHQLEIATPSPAEVFLMS